MINSFKCNANDKRKRTKREKRFLHHKARSNSSSQFRWLSCSFFLGGCRLEVSKNCENITMCNLEGVLNLEYLFVVNVHVHIYKELMPNSSFFFFFFESYAHWHILVSIFLFGKVYPYKLILNEYWSTSPFKIIIKRFCFFSLASRFQNFFLLCPNKFRNLDWITVLVYNFCCLLEVFSKVTPELVGSLRPYKKLEMLNFIFVLFFTD